MNEQQLTDEEQLAEDIAGFEFDPLGHVMYCYPWGVAGTELAKKKGPRRWQKKVLNRIGRKLEEGGELGAVIREAVASGHGIGKSALVAWIIRWALDTFEDTKGVVTANTGAQLKTKTWAELAKWHRLSITSHWFERTATGIYSTDPDHKDTWRIDAIPWSKENSEAFAGLHNEGKRIIVIFDEASAIDDIIWEVTEGALTDDLTQIIWLCFGNPTRSTGRFRECFRRFRRLWGHEQVDSRTVEGVNTKQADEWIETYGEDSDFVKIRVRGIFPNVSARQFISEEAVRTAQSRHLRKEQYDFAPRILTLDNAWEGDDLAVIGFRQGLFFKVLAKYPKNDNDIEIANALAAFEDEYEADAVFIDAGYGTGVVSAGRTMGRNWTLVWFGGKWSITIFQRLPLSHSAPL